LFGDLHDAIQVVARRFEFRAGGQCIGDGRCATGSSPSWRERASALTTKTIGRQASSLGSGSGTPYKQRMFSRCVAKFYGETTPGWKLDQIEQTMAWIDTVGESFPKRHWYAGWTFELPNDERIDIETRSTSLGDPSLSRGRDGLLVEAALTNERLGTLIWRPSFSFSISSGPGTRADVILPECSRDEVVGSFETVAKIVSQLMVINYAFGDVLPVWSLASWLGMREKPHIPGKAIKETWDQQASRYSGANWNSLAAAMNGVRRWQILSPRHLAKSVGAISLREWIVSSPRRGKLIPFASDRVQWIVPHQITGKLTDELSRAGFNFLS
jgi:hypothetical protein